MEVPGCVVGHRLPVGRSIGGVTVSAPALGCGSPGVFAVVSSVAVVCVSSIGVHYEDGSVDPVDGTGGGVGCEGASCTTKDLYTGMHGVSVSVSYSTSSARRTRGTGGGRGVFLCVVGGVRGRMVSEVGVSAPMVDARGKRRVLSSAVWSFHVWCVD